MPDRGKSGKIDKTGSRVWENNMEGTGDGAQGLKARAREEKRSKAKRRQIAQGITCPVVLSAGTEMFSTGAGH